MAERETKDIVILRGAHKLTVKTYLTAREMMGLLDEPDMLTSKKAQFMMEQTITALDDSAEKIIDRVLDLPLEAYTAIIKEVSAIVNPTKPGSSDQTGKGTSETAH